MLHLINKTVQNQPSLKISVSSKRQQQMSEQKSKKPFLKRGTRQFLSNAQVRSLNQKPRIVQFSEEDFQQTSSPFTNSNQPKKDIKQDIVIAVKPKNIQRDKSQSALNKAKQTNKKTTNNLAQRTKESRNQSNFEEQVVSGSKPAPSSHSLSKGSQKKPTLLADYLNNDSKPIAKKPVQAQIPSPVPKTNSIKSYQPVVQSQAQHLKMQDIDEDSDDDHKVVKSKKNYRNDDNEENQFMAKRAKEQSSPEQVKKVEPLKKKPNLLLQNFQNKREKENLNMQNQRSDERPEQNDVNFNSDSDEDEKNKKNQFKTKTNKTLHQNRFNKDMNENEEQEHSDNEDQVNRKATVKLGTKTQSKVTQMFNKNVNQKANSQAISEPEPIKSKMTVKDIPQELIEELVNMYFNDAKQKYQKKQQNLFEQVKVVQKKQQSLNEQEKNLEKRIKQHEKQMEQKSKEFQNKIKSEQSKITREKMYLKDQQTTGKADWKAKNQIQELKQQLQEQRNERKRIEVKLKGELDRLKARFSEQMEIKKNLENRIKDYELREIKQKQQQVKQLKQQKQETIKRKQALWEDAPKKSYLQRFFSNDFSLTQLSIEDYLYTKNEFYKYYELKKDQGQLQMQQNEGNKIRRTYDNNKIQIQSPNKFIKQIFPWGFIIVHYINGDVKQVIQLPKDANTTSPKKIEIYFAKNSYIIEYSIADGKRIHYFLNDDQVEFNNQLIDVKEVYTGNQMQRTERGNAKTFQKNAKGNFVEIY